MGLTRREAWVALVSAALALSTVMALAAHGDGPPRLIPYQGTLELDGQPVDDDVDLTLRLHNAPSAGTELWAESLAGVPVRAGRFAVVLGDVTPLPSAVFDEEQLWLELSVDGTALTSRQRVLPVPQAVASRQASSFTVTHDLAWSAGGELRDDQGGSIELGGGDGTTPYVDFHSDGSSADYSSRLIANAQGLRVQGNGALGNGLVVDGVMTANQGVIQNRLSADQVTTDELAVAGAAYVGSLSAVATKMCSAIRPDEWRTDIQVAATWTNGDCGAFAFTVGAETHTLGCLFRSDTGNAATPKFSVGSPGGGVPSPNCGW